MEHENITNKICIDEDGNEETLIRLFSERLRLENQDSKEQLINISSNLNMTVEETKNMIKETFSKYRDKMILQPKLLNLIKCQETSLFYEFCLENINDVCRLCLRLRGDVKMSEALDANLDTGSSDLTTKINFTLQENETFGEKLKFIDVCEICLEKIEDFYIFKKQCHKNTEMLMQVKKELDVMQAIGEESFDENSQVEISGMTEEEESTVPKENKKLPKVKRVKTLSDKTRKSYKGKSSQCSVCGKIVKGIQMHMLIHSGLKKHNCPYCPKTFTQSGQLRRHINSHLNIRNYECPEPGCDRTFVDPSSVTKHLVVHNKDDRKYQCSTCGSRFNRLGALRYHEKTHRQERNHHCDICSKSFLAKYDLTKHYRSHTGEKPYNCPFCDKRFSISKNAKVHIRAVHAKEKPYDCKFCDLSFAYRSSMKNHLIKIHNHVSVLPLNTVIRSDSDQNEINQELMTENHQESVNKLLVPQDVLLTINIQ